MATSPSTSFRPTRPQGFWGLWWRRQPPSRQDRFATLGPLLSVLLFLAAMVSSFWYLRNEENEHTLDSVRRDADLTQQQIRLQLLEGQEQLVRIAREVSTHAIDKTSFSQQAADFIESRPEIVYLKWIDAQGHVQANQLSQRHEQAFPTSPHAASNTDSRESEPQKTLQQVRDSLTVRYSGPFTHDQGGGSAIQVIIPLLDRNTFSGALVAEYSLKTLLRQHVPREVEKRHEISIVNLQNSTILASTASVGLHSKPNEFGNSSMLAHDVLLPPIPDYVVLRSAGYRNTAGLLSNTLFLMVVALSFLTVWMLLGTWRHMRRRLQAQDALSAETNFRRAMENSMLTGMRAMDLEGRITYVNPAFCAMTGFADTELIGVMPPFPHWPPNRQEENMRLLQLELQGRSPAGGLEVKIMRKDGSIFDARMYVSPLIDARGQQTGWMTSMTNITEAKRVRDQLSASHERFTTVLEGLEAAVSVVSVGRGELLFANRSYRLWFCADAMGHTHLAGDHLSPQQSSLEGGDSVDSYSGLPTHEITSASAEMQEVYVDSLQKWFDVRARYLQWTDGRLAQMVIATDISARRQAEELARHQAEKAQVTSRLMTMGEMASSVAHELNQPLTAITNYCNGMVSRVKANSIHQDDLIAALEKTAKQAQRAGQIIHRIRNFVKRSEPQRQPSSLQQIIDDAADLANIEMRRCGVTLRTYVAQNLPLVFVDPILIEQVILNLLRNAAEAIDSAHMPTTRRNIELRLIPRQTSAEDRFIECTITDSGPGLPEDVIPRLYEAFFSTKVDGMGIGLSLCRSIIESHRGRIKAENLYNGAEVTGCCFTFTLPVEKADTPPQALSETESA